jgi:hypothetical protein
LKKAKSVKLASNTALQTDERRALVSAHRTWLSRRSRLSAKIVRPHAETVGSNIFRENFMTEQAWLADITFTENVARVCGDPYVAQVLDVITRQSVAVIARAKHRFLNDGKRAWWNYTDRVFENRSGQPKL